MSSCYFYSPDRFYEYWKYKLIESILCITEYAADHGWTVTDNKYIVHLYGNKRKILLFPPQIIKDFSIMTEYTEFQECSRNKAAPKLSYTYSRRPLNSMHCHCTAAGAERATEDFYNEYSK